MSSDYKKENDQQNVANNHNVTRENQTLSFNDWKTLKYSQNGQQNVANNHNLTRDNQTFSFNDWKTLKYSQNKTNAKSQNNEKLTKSNSNNINTPSASGNNRNVYNYNKFNAPMVSVGHGVSDFFAGRNDVPSNNFSKMNNIFGTLSCNLEPKNNNFSSNSNFNRPRSIFGDNVASKSNSNNKNTPIASGNNRNVYNYNKFNAPMVSVGHRVSDFFAGRNDVLSNNFSKMNNIFGTRSNNLEPKNNNFSCSNSNINRPSIFGDNVASRFDSNVPKNYSDPNTLFHCFGKDHDKLNGYNEVNKFDLPVSFFASDGIYRQKDMIQPLINNPIRNELKANQLLPEFNKPRYSKDEKKKKKGNRKPAEAQKSNYSTNGLQKFLGDTRKRGNKPKVYVPNPKVKIDGKQYIPKPKLPEVNLEISKEEKKQQWKEYREAMKPFKNREFYNAKRVVQRLGKKAPSDLDEKDLIRLAKSREIMAAHKAHLSAKYANYIKADDSSNELGKLYVLQKKTQKNDSEFGKPTIKQFQNYLNFGGSDVSDSGRKSMRGFAGFVGGGLLEGMPQSLSTS